VAPSRKNGKQPVGSTLRAIRVLMGAAVFTIIAIAAPVVATVAAIGMLPTAIALVIDRSKNKHPACAVAGLNLAGVFPFLPTLWLHGPDAATGKDVLENALTLSTMFGAAAVGWVLVATLPGLVNAIDRAFVLRRCSMLRDHQRRLREEWGPDVSKGTAPTVLPPR
jgi:hypothetical protein